MTLMAYGYTVLNLACDKSRSCTNEATFNDNAPKIAQLLKQAAGIFNFVVTQVKIFSH